MYIKQIVIFTSLVVFITGCMTTRLWETTDPQKYVEISMNEITEKDLINKKIRYYKDPTKSLYYVEKSGAEKIQGYVLRILATPITVVLDTATVIVVVGLMSIRIHNIHINIK